MKSESKLARIITVSPWFLLVFLAIPVCAVLSIKFNVQIPFIGSRALLANNICFTLLIAFRLVRYLAVAGRGARYCPAFGRPGSVETLRRPASELRKDLSKAGYVFSQGGSYAERRELGYLGTTVLYGGLFLLLATGSWDNLKQFSGVLLDGVGPATKLGKYESYRQFTKGPLSPRLDSLPSMRILKQYMPGESYPRGATEISLFAEDGKGLTTILKPTEPVPYGAFDIYMTKIVFEPEIVIKHKDAGILFDEIVKLDPLVEKRGRFGFYGLFIGASLVGGIYYDPELSEMMAVITRNGKKVVADLTFQVDQQVEKDGYILSCAKLGQWSEIHVVHRRHKGLLFFGGIVALIGLIMRIAIRPQRVWLEERAEGCSASAVGKETRALLGV